MKIDRRKFLKNTGVLCGMGAAGIALFMESCKKSNTTDTTPQGPTVNFTLDLSSGSNAVLNSNGGSLSKNGVVIANVSNQFVAVAERCTHEGCSIAYNQSGNNFVCPCHNGKFDLNGNVTSGPPPAPVKKYTIQKNGNILTVAG